MTSGLGLLRWALLAATLFCIACAPGVSIRSPEAKPTSEEDRNRAAQRELESARVLQQKDRLGSALRTVDRGLALEPPDAKLHAKLHRLAAELHQEHYDNYRAAVLHRARAEELDPTPTPPPPEVHPVDASGLLIALLPPQPANARSNARGRSNALAEWPDGIVANTLKERLELRLPGASVEIIASRDHPTSQSTAAARAWLSERDPAAILTLRTDRCYCGESVREGRFSVVWIRIAQVIGNGIAATPRLARFARDADHAPLDADGCHYDALARVVERLLQSPSFESALAAVGPAQVRTLSSGAIADLFPGLGRRLAATLGEARMLFANGQLGAARDAFTLALAIDPENADARVYLAEIDSTLAIAAQLDSLMGQEAKERLDPGISLAEQERIARQIEEQQRQRVELLAAMAVVEGEPNLPAALDLAVLQSASIDDPRALGPSLARRLAGDVVEARRLYGPDGGPIARYFVTPGAEMPILREEDTSGDGRPDRFTAYRGRERSEVWEDPQGVGRVERHLFYAAGGEQIERADIDSTGDGRIDRRLRYRDGFLASELRDTNGDGRFDVTDHLGKDGVLSLREEDRDGDGQIDVRSTYREGRLVRREILDPELARGIRRQGGL